MGEGGSVTFTVRGTLAGARRCVPVAVGGFAIGLVFGVLAGQAGVGTLEALLMSATVFSGAAQFAAIGVWENPVPVSALGITALVIGLRHLLMGAALSPVFGKLPRGRAYASVFFMADENWALTMEEFRRGGRDAAFLIGGGLLMFLSWTSATLVGKTAGSLVEDPARWGLDFAFTAVFIALLAGMWRGRSSDLVPWVTAAAAAVVSNLLLPGQWHVLIGGLVGTAAGALRSPRGD